MTKLLLYVRRNIFAMLLVVWGWMAIVSPTFSSDIVLSLFFLSLSPTITGVVLLVVGLLYLLFSWCEVPLLRIAGSGALIAVYAIIAGLYITQGVYALLWLGIVGIVIYEVISLVLIVRGDI